MKALVATALAVLGLAACTAAPPPPPPAIAPPAASVVPDDSTNASPPPQPTGSQGYPSPDLPPAFRPPGGV